MVTRCKGLHSGPIEVACIARASTYGFAVRVGVSPNTFGWVKFIFYV